MFPVVFFIVLFLVSQGYIVLEEETLIILASFLWVDAAGGAIRSALDNALIQKGNSIHESFVYFLNLKKRLIQKLIVSHKNRISLADTLKSIYEYSLHSLIANSLVFYTSICKNIKLDHLQNLSFEKAQSISRAYLSRRLGYTFGLLHKSGSGINTNVSTNHVTPSINYGEVSVTKFRNFV